jgi:hypothetical protein
VLPFAKALPGWMQGTGTIGIDLAISGIVGSVLLLLALFLLAEAFNVLVLKGGTPPQSKPEPSAA